MARIIFSPIIGAASGKAADVVFARWKGTNYIRQRVIPANPQTDLQTAQREALARVLLLWRTLEQQIKDQLDRYAVNYGMSGYNWTMQKNVVLEKTNEFNVLTPNNPDVEGPLTFVCVSPNVKRIKADWTGGDAGADYKVYVLAREILPAVVNDLLVVSHDDVNMDGTTLTTAPDYTSGSTYITMLCSERVADHKFSFSRASSVLVL